MTAAMLLAAGYGTRLRPLTETLPKALAPVGGRPLLDWHLDALEVLGVDLVAINASHRAEQIEGHVGERKSPQIKVLREETPLGTGGGLLGARALLEDERRFIVSNADIFHAIKPGDVLEAHDGMEADATLAVRRAAPSEPQDELTIGSDGTVDGLGRTGGARSGWRFTGIHVLTPEIFGRLESPGSLVTGYEKLLAAGARIVAHDVGEATWFDIGTPDDHIEADRSAAAMLGSGAG